MINITEKAQGNEQKAWMKAFSSKQLAGVIYTKLKFVRSNKSGMFVGFASKQRTTGMVRGVREEAPYPKKVCVVNKPLDSQITPDVLYNCTIVPMKSGNGYIVVEATPTQFAAHITSQYIKNTTYLVTVKFGGSSIIFNPFSGRQESVKDLASCRALLEKRVDIKNVGQVVKHFTEAAQMMLRLLNRDKYTLKKL